MCGHVGLKEARARVYKVLMVCVKGAGRLDYEEQIVALISHMSRVQIPDGTVQEKTVGGSAGEGL